MRGKNYFLSNKDELPEDMRVCNVIPYAGKTVSNLVSTYLILDSNSRCRRPIFFNKLITLLNSFTVISSLHVSSNWYIVRAIAEDSSSLFLLVLFLFILFCPTTLMLGYNFASLTGIAKEEIA